MSNLQTPIFLPTSIKGIDIMAAIGFANLRPIGIWCFISYEGQRCQPVRCDVTYKFKEERLVLDRFIDKTKWEEDCAARLMGYPSPSVEGEQVIHITVENNGDRVVGHWTKKTL